MTIKNIYLPETKGKHPAIIGLPGFVSPIEGSRTESLLENLSKRGFVGIDVRYPGVRKEDNRIVCGFNREDYKEAFQEAIKCAQSNDRINPSKIGVFASSIGGTVIALYLASENAPPIKSLALVSPCLGWNYFGTPEQRAQIEQTGTDIPITTQADIERGIARIIPRESLPEMKSADALKFLENYTPTGDMQVITLLGKQDIVSPPEAMREFHYKLGGKKEGLHEFSCGHAIPHSECSERIESFFQETLSS